MAADLLADPNNLLRSSSLYHMGKPLVSAIAASADFSIPNDSINQIKTDLVGTYTIWVVLIAAYIRCQKLQWRWASASDSAPLS